MLAEVLIWSVSCLLYRLWGSLPCGQILSQAMNITIVSEFAILIGSWAVHNPNWNLYPNIRGSWYFSQLVLCQGAVLQECWKSAFYIGHICFPIKHINCCRAAFYIGYSWKIRLFLLPVYVSSLWAILIFLWLKFCHSSFFPNLRRR